MRLPIEHEHAEPIEHAERTESFNAFRRWTRRGRPSGPALPWPFTPTFPPRRGSGTRPPLARVDAAVRTNTGRGQGCREAAAAAWHYLFFERRRADPLVGQRERQYHGTRSGGCAIAAAPGGHGIHPGAL